MHAGCTSSCAVARPAAAAPAARHASSASTFAAGRSSCASTSRAVSLGPIRRRRGKNAATEIRARGDGDSWARDWRDRDYEDERAPRDDYGDDYYDDAYDNRGPPNERRGRDDGYYDRDPRTAGASSQNDNYRDDERQAPPGGPPPDVTLLTQREIQSLLPIGATGEQYAYFWGGPETAVQRLGVSLVGLVATVNLTALLAVPTATFFLWAPVALAARRNSSARRGRNIGLWRARVLAVGTRDAAPGPGYFDERSGRDEYGSGRTPSRESWMLSLLVGDYSGARVELRVPLQRSHAQIVEGDEVEMVVGSDESYFARFEAVREAYFPRSGTWVGEYPFLDRRAMPAISGRIERDRETWAANRDRDREASEY